MQQRKGKNRVQRLPNLPTLPFYTTPRPISATPWSRAASQRKLHKQASWLQYGWSVSWIGVAWSSVISCLDAQCDMCTMRQRTCHHPVISPCRSSQMNACKIRSIWMITPDETCAVLSSFAVHCKRAKRSWTGSWKADAMQRLESILFASQGLVIRQSWCHVLWTPSR